MAIDLEAPGIPTYWGTGETVQYTPEYDAATVAMRDQMNAITSYQPTFPVAFNVYVRSTGPGIGDNQYNVGYHHVPVPSGIEHLAYRYEAPDVPVTHLPYMEQLFNSTLTQAYVNGQVVFNALRSPTPNEGIF